ncbi:MAG: hypothetical protein ACREN1_00950 [Candidatus Dormibacteria bacterium]
MRISSPHGGCPGPCDPTIDVAPLGSNEWTTAFVPTPTYQDGAELVRQGADVYSLFPGNPAGGGGNPQHADLYISQDGGTVWEHEDDPCGYTGTMPDDAVSMAAAPQGVLVVLCTLRPVGANFLIVSATAGMAFGPRQALPVGSGFQLAAASSSSLVVGNADGTALDSVTYLLLHSGDGGQHWQTVVDEKGPSTGLPLSFLGFENPSDGRWIGPASTLWTTTDSGAVWTPSRF